MSSPCGTAGYDRFVGVDIAAKTFTASWLDPGGAPTRPVTLQQTASGYDELRERLLSTGSVPERILVVMEATGSYWITLATTLVGAGFVVGVINPAQAHHFAKALLRRAKTDAIDAQTLARLAELLRPQPWTPPPAIWTELQQRLAQRDALISMQRQVRNRSHALEQGPVVIASVRVRMESLIATLGEQIAEVEGEIERALEMDEEWARSAERLRSIPGVGIITAAWLLVATLNFTLCESAEAATSYAGLAPHPRQSGTSVRGKPTIGHTGSGRLRTALYLATLSASQHNPVIKGFYERLREAGKPVKVARCAAARKLLHVAWAVGTSGESFDPEYQKKRQQPECAVA